MHGPPLELHVDPTAKPFAVYTPASVPLHWAEKVRSDLKRDVELGVLERVDENIPVTWWPGWLFAGRGMVTQGEPSICNH